MTTMVLVRYFVGLVALLLPLAAAAEALRPVTVADRLENPWGLAFLPDGRMLVTERPGRMRIVGTDGQVGAPLEGLPAVQAGGQGGLLDVAVHPAFAENGFVYWSYSESGDGGNSTAVARGKLAGNRLEDVRVVFQQKPKVASALHFGSRLVFARDGRLFVTLGDRYQRKDDAQTLDTHHGKVVRIEADGSVPKDNPFVGRAGALPEIWSYGHRNLQGAALHPATGELWTHEHGPQGGDEFNLTTRGNNFGWPVITYGRNYGTGTKIGEATQRADIPEPAVHWIPSIAPSGLAFLTSDRYGAAWKGSAFVGALKAQALVRLEMDGNKVTRQERLLENLGERIRDVRQGPDGWLYVLTDARNGKVIRLER